MSEVEQTVWLSGIKELKKSYLATHRMLSSKKRELLEEASKLTDGVSPRELRKKDKEMYKSLKVDNKNLFADIAHIEEMITDVNIAIGIMDTGRYPGSKRGVERKGAYELDGWYDPLYTQYYAASYNTRSSSTLTKQQHDQITDALSRLSKNERECYIMAHGDCMSFSDIARHMVISRSSVQKNVERARKKISQDLDQSLFLWNFSWDGKTDGDGEGK